MAEIGHSLHIFSRAVCRTFTQQLALQLIENSVKKILASKAHFTVDTELMYGNEALHPKLEEMLTHLWTNKQSSADIGSLQK